MDRWTELLREKMQNIVELFIAQSKREREPFECTAAGKSRMILISI